MKVMLRISAFALLVLAGITLIEASVTPSWGEALFDLLGALILVNVTYLAGLEP